MKKLKIIFLVVTCLLVGLVCYSLLDSPIVWAQQCGSYGDWVDPPGCCNYGDENKNPYFIPPAPDCAAKCHQENIGGNFPYGSCQYCNPNVCVRNDWGGDCAKMCNWACCYYGPNPTPTPPPTSLVCKPKEWLCKTEDTILPDVLCCWWQCLPKEILPPKKCPTNKDWGQKDGTGQTGNSRRYPYYDYDLRDYVEVPPVLPEVTNVTPTPAPPSGCQPPSGWPAGSGQVTLSYHACHPNRGCHTGIDIVTFENNQVHSTLSGTVAFAGDSGSAGKRVVVECGNWEYAVGFYHLNNVSVQEGDQVIAGQTVIGTEGRTGNVTGSHLHYELLKDRQLVDPAPYIPYSGCVAWNEGGLGGGFCPGSNCTPECPDTGACGKARQQGQCATALNLQKGFLELTMKFKDTFLGFWKKFNVS